MLYLRGLSAGDFREALTTLRGDDAAGLSATNIVRLTNEWETEYRAFQKRTLADRDYVYVWVDGIHFNVWLEDDPSTVGRDVGANVVVTREEAAEPPPDRGLCVCPAGSHAGLRLALGDEREASRATGAVYRHRPQARKARGKALPADRRVTAGRADHHRRRRSLTSGRRRSGRGWSPWPRP